MSHWRELYDAAEIEPNPVFLTYLLEEVEDAIWSRLQELEELEPNSNSQNERQEITEVIFKMLTLRVEKLGWPALVTAD